MANVPASVPFVVGQEDQTIDVVPLSVYTAPETWRFVLANSSDLSAIGELNQARGKSVNVLLNRGGSLAFSYPMKDEIAGYIEPITTCVKAYRMSSKSSLWECIWSGPVWTIEESLQESMMTVNCVGWMEMLNKRLIRMERNYQNLDDGEIIRLLLEHANKLNFEDFISPEYTVTTPPGWANSATPTHIGWGGTMPNEGIGGVTPYVPQTRNRSYQRYQAIGPAIQEITEYENGCDIWISPEERRLYVYRKRQRITSVVFGFDWGPNNLQQFSRSLDASQVVNFMQATGRPGTTPQYADTRNPAFTGWRVGAAGAYDPNPNTQTQYGIFEEVVNLSDVANDTVLSTYAAAEIYVRYRPRIIYSMTPFPFTTGGSIPEPFVDYNIGDQVLLTASMEPRIQIQNQGVRVFGISVSIDEEGNEQLAALQTSPT